MTPIGPDREHCVAQDFALDLQIALQDVGELETWVDQRNISGLEQRRGTYLIWKQLVLFLGLCGRRIEEAIGIKPTDLDDTNVLHIRRVISNGRVEELAEEEHQVLPLDQPEHAELVRRLRALGKGHEWVFHSRKGTPINPGNARRRHLHPAAEAVGIKIGGWHDFRHAFIRNLRRGGVHPVVVSAVVGHKRVELAPEVYDRATNDEKRQALGVVGRQLLPIGSNLTSVQ